MTSRPGEEIQLTVKASSDSVFALSAVDRSVQLLAETNNIKEGDVST